MKTYIPIAIILVVACILGLHYAKPRTDALSDTITRNAESRLRSIVGALETSCMAVEMAKTNSVIETAILSIDKDMKVQGIDLFKLPIVKNDIWVSVNPDLELWRNPQKNTNDIAVYWEIPLRTNESVSEYLGMTFARRAVWFTNIPTWFPFSASNITSRQ